MAASRQPLEQNWLAGALFISPRVKNWKIWAAHRESVAEAKALDAWHQVFFWIGH
jgi:hypothetical protein